MSGLAGIYETDNKDSLIRDYLSCKKYNGSFIIVKDSTGLMNKSGVIISTPLRCMFYINPKECKNIFEAVLYVTDFFNEYTPFVDSDGVTQTLKSLKTLK